MTYTEGMKQARLMVPKVTRRLQNRLIFAFVVVLLIPTGIISFYSLRTAANTLIQKIGAEELRGLVSQANDLEKRLIDVKEDLIFLSLAPTDAPLCHRHQRKLRMPPTAYRDAQIALLKTFLDRSTTDALSRLSDHQSRGAGTAARQQVGRAAAQFQRRQFRRRSLFQPGDWAARAAGLHLRL